MRILLGTLRFVLWLLVCAVGQYEVAAKSDRWLAVPLPSGREARQADAETPYRAWTRVPVVDRLIHESREAARYYERLLR